MTTITLAGLNAALGAAEPIQNGTLEVTYWAGGAPVTRIDGANVLLPATMRTAIVGGAPVKPLVIDATDDTFCVKWRIQSRARVYERFTSIPESETPVDFGDLPVVDEATFAPVPAPATLGQTIDNRIEEYLATRPLLPSEGLVL